MSIISSAGHDSRLKKEYVTSISYHAGSASNSDSALALFLSSFSDIVVDVRLGKIKRVLEGRVSEEKIEPANVPQGCSVLLAS